MAGVRYVLADSPQKFAQPGQVEVWTYPAVDIETSSIPLGFLYQDDVIGVTPNLFAMQLPQVWDLVFSPTRIDVFVGVAWSYSISWRCENCRGTAFWQSREPTPR